MPTRIAVDAMGGDHAPDVVVKGVAEALKESAGELFIHLLGPEERLRPLVHELDDNVRSSIKIVHAPEVIAMDESPTAAIKSKRKSSICIGMGMCKASKADAFISAGNTGAIMAGALFILGRLPGVSRPSVIGYFPTMKGTTILLDVGTNVGCKPDHLLQFARMGAIYAECVMGADKATVGLLNVGEEPGKGDDLARCAYEKMSNAEGLNFIGNVEGRDVMRHAADVLVCDGFVGNILLKYGESVASVLPQMIGAEMRRLGMTDDEQKIVERALSGVKVRFDYKEYGGAPLLGVDGTVFIGHGSSNGYAIKNLVLAADKMVRERVSEKIASVMDA